MASSTPETVLGSGWYVEISSSKIPQFTDMTLTLRDSENGSELVEIYKENEYFDSLSLENDNPITYKFKEYGRYTIFNGNASVTQWSVEESYLINFMNVERLFVNSREIRRLKDCFGQILFDNTNFDTSLLWDIVFNINNYNGHTNKSCSVTNNVLTNYAVSSISLNTEFTSSTNYTLEFDYYTIVGNRNGFYFGVDPSLEDGVSINNSDDGLQVYVDIGNTLVQTFNGTSSPTNVYTHTSNLLTPGTHHIRIVRDGSNATFYIDDVELYTYTNTQYNTIGINKWGGGHNTISNVEITIDD